MHAVCLLFQNSSMLAKLDYTLTYIPNHPDEEGEGEEAAEDGDAPDETRD